MKKHGESAVSPLGPILAMLDAAPSATPAEVMGALYARLNRPPTAAELRVGELGVLARLLDEYPQRADAPPYVSRKLYDERRRSVGGVSSAVLQQRFGSWARACYAAWGLQEDGRSWGPGQPWRRTPRGRDYTIEEVVQSMRDCAAAIGHRPSSKEYHEWVLHHRRQALRQGRKIRLAHYATVLRLLAADHEHGKGWATACADVFGE